MGAVEVEVAPGESQPLVAEFDTVGYTEGVAVFDAVFDTVLDAAWVEGKGAPVREKPVMPVVVEAAQSRSEMAQLFHAAPAPAGSLLFLPHIGLLVRQPLVAAEGLEGRMLEAALGSAAAPAAARSVIRVSAGAEAVSTRLLVVRVESE